MPRILSAATILEKNRTDSDHPFCLLFELNIENGPGPYRFVAYDQDVTFHGLFFGRTVADIDSLEEVTGGALTHLKINAQNVDQAFISLYENYWVTVADPLWTVLVWQADAKNPDATAYESAEIYSVLSNSTDFVQASIDLIAEGITLGTTIPKRRYTALAGFRIYLGPYKRAARMINIQALPDIRKLIDPLLGKTPRELYGTVLRTEAEVDKPCFALVRHLLLTGLWIDLEADPEEAAQSVYEVWWRDTDVLLTTVVRAWDLLVIGGTNRITTHVCLAVDNEYFLHIRRTPGVVLERYSRWKDYIMQLARLRMLA